MNIPRGYVYKDYPKSVMEAVDSSSNDRVKFITKTAIKDYIASFFNSDGNKRELLNGFSTASLQYITDKSYEGERDSTKRYMQLAIFFEELRKKLPFIIILDNGIIPVKSSIGQNIDSVKLVGSKTIINVPIIRKLNINVVVGTRDEETTDILSTALSILFNEMHFLGGGDRLSGDYQRGNLWEVRLPYEGISQSANQHDLITDDPTDSLWWVETSLDNTWFEDIIQLDAGYSTFQEAIPIVDAQIGNRVNIVFPDTIRFNNTYALDVTGHDGRIVVNIDQPNIANFNPQSGTIIPRRLGFFTIRVMEAVAKGSEDGLLTEKVVEVTF